MRLITVPGVFRPHSDSRLLAELATARVRERRSLGMPTSVCDPFTGSGVLAVSAAIAGAEGVTAVDLSRRAVACAWANARLHRTRVRALRGDIFGPLAGERFDLIVANPPYLPGAAAPPARGAARAWEGGVDGRLLIDRLCAEVPAHLRPGGELLLVQSSVCGLEPTLAALGAGGLVAEVIERRRGPLGPLLAGRAEELERRGILAPGQREEEIEVIRAVAAEPPAASEGRGRAPHMSVVAG